MYAPITSSSFEVAMLQMKVADKLSGCLPELLALVQWEDALNMEMMLPGKKQKIGSYIIC